MATSPSDDFIEQYLDFDPSQMATVTEDMDHTKKTGRMEQVKAESAPVRDAEMSLRLLLGFKQPEAMPSEQSRTPPLPDGLLKATCPENASENSAAEKLHHL